jgi:outer membrane lipoprotein-sorting protein
VARPYPPPSAAELVAALEAQQHLVRSLNARARATSWLGGERVRATVLMLVDRPGRLRFEAEVSLQGTVAILATDGERFALYDATKNVLQLGPACPANVASLIRIPLLPADIAAILLGDVRIDHLPGTREVDWDGTRAADVLAVPRADGKLQLFWQRPGGQVRLVGVSAVGSDGRNRWRVSFEDFAEVSAGPAGPPRGVALPQTIHFAQGDESFDNGVEIKLKERRLNEPLAADAFTLRPPSGATVSQVGCGP